MTRRISVFFSKKKQKNKKQKQKQQQQNNNNNNKKKKKKKHKTNSLWDMTLNDNSRAPKCENFYECNKAP